MPTPSEILSLPSGAQWVKADLHVHTPASADIDEQWKDATPQDVVRIAIDNGLALIAITDHNTAGWCDRVREAADGTDLAVFPGVEISTPQGHLLAVFDTDVPSVHIEDLLISVGFSRDQFGDLHAAATQGIAEVSAKITEFGGVAIAAHADGNRGFLQMIGVGAERERAYTARDLWAIELLDTSTREQHQSGNRYPRRMTCIQSSDCWPKGADHHQLDGMGYRHTFLKMGEKTLDGLKLALIDPDIRVRLVEDVSYAPDNVILGMWVTGGFLDDQIIRFNENVSCFIGDTGSGKSVATELIRFCLDQQPIVEKIRREVESLLRQQLGDLGVIHILLIKSGSYYLVERAWSSTPEKPTTRRVSGDDLQPVDGLDIRTFFPIKCFSQSEIIEFAREPGVRLSLTDDLIDCSTELANIGDVKARLRENASSIIAEQTKEANIYDQLMARAMLVEDIASIDKVLNNNRVEQQQLWYDEQTILDQAKKLVAELCEKPPVSTVQLDLKSPCPTDMLSLPNKDILDKLNTAFDIWSGQVEAIRAEATSKLDDLRKTVGGLHGEWDARFQKAEAEYQRLLTELDEDGIGLQTLSERRKAKQEQMTALDDVERELQELVLPRLRDLNQTREGLLDQLQANRKSITDKRITKSKELSTKLNHKVRLQVRARANFSDFGQSLQDLVSGSRSFTSRPSED